MPAAASSHRNCVFKGASRSYRKLVARMDALIPAPAEEDSRAGAEQQQLPTGIVAAVVQVRTTDADAAVMHVDVAVRVRQEPATLPDVRVAQSQPLLPAVHGDAAGAAGAPSVARSAPQEQQQQQDAGEKEEGAGGGGQPQPHPQGEQQHTGGATAQVGAVRHIPAVPPTQALAPVPATYPEPAEAEAGGGVMAEAMEAGTALRSEEHGGAPERGTLLPPTMPNTVPQSVAPASAAIDDQVCGGGGGGAGAGGGKLVSPGSVRGPRRQLEGTGGDAVGLSTRGVGEVVVGEELPPRGGDAVAGDRARELANMGGRAVVRSLGSALDRAAVGAAAREQQQGQQQGEQGKGQEEEEQQLVQPQGEEAKTKQKGEEAEGGGLGEGGSAGSEAVVGVAREGGKLHGSHAAAKAVPAKPQHDVSGQPDHAMQRQQPTGRAEPQPSTLSRGGNEQSGSGRAAADQHVVAPAAQPESVDVQLDLAPAAAASAGELGGAGATGADTGNAQAAAAVTHGSGGAAGGAVPASADPLQPHVGDGVEGSEVPLVASLAQGIGLAPLAPAQLQPEDGTAVPSGGGRRQQAGEGSALNSGLGEIVAGREVQVGGFEFAALGDRAGGWRGEEQLQEQEQGTKAAAESAGGGGPMVVVGKGAAEAGGPARRVPDSMDPERLPGATGARVEDRALSKEDASTTGAGQGVGDTDVGMEREGVLPGAGEDFVQDQAQPPSPAVQGPRASPRESQPSPLQRRSLFGFLRSALQRDARAAAAAAEPARAAASAGKQAPGDAAAAPDAEQQLEQQQQQAGPSREHARDPEMPRSSGGGGGGNGGVRTARVGSPRQQPPKSAAPATTTTTSVTTRSGGRGAGGGSPLVVAATTTTTIGTEAVSGDRTPRSAVRRAGESSAYVASHTGGKGDLKCTVRCQCLTVWDVKKAC